MKRIIIFSLALVVCARLAVGQEANRSAASAADPGTIAERVQWLIDGIADKPRRNVEIVIRGNRISEVHASNYHSCRPPAWQPYELIDS